MRQIVKFNVHFQIMWDDDAAFKFVRVEIICLSFDDDNKIWVNKTVYASIIKSLNENVFE